MRTIRFMACALVALLASPAFAENPACGWYLEVCADKYERYNQATNQITADLEAKRITATEAGNRVVALAKNMYPNDTLLASITTQQAALAEILARSKLGEKDKALLEETAQQTFLQALGFRKVLVNVALEQEQAVAQSTQVAPQAAPQSNNAFAIATLLSGIGKAFSNSFGQQMIAPRQICQYYGNTMYCQ